MNMQAEKKIEIPSGRQLLILLPFAVLYASFLILGDLERAVKESPVLIGGRFLFYFAAAYAILTVLCVVISGWKGITAQIPFLQRAGEKRSKTGERQGKWYHYLFFFLICLLCYLPYFLMYFPTWLNNDAVWQLEQILGLAEPSNHHPYFHTMILKFFFLSGYGIFGTYTGGAAFYTFWQICIMSMVFAFFLFQLYKRGTRLIWLACSLFFYAALPANGVLTICMGKDEFFTAALMLYSWMSAEIFARMKSMRGAAGYFITGFLVCVLRSNGIFIFIGTSVILLFVILRKKDDVGKAFVLRTGICFAAILMCYLVYHGPVLRALHVQPPDTIEGLTMPTQHLLCAYLKGGELTEEEIQMIDAVVPAEQVGEYYNPWFFDLTKNFIRSDGNQQVIEDNKWDYFKLWLRAGLRNPLQYVVAQVRQTQGYWAFKLKNYQYIYGDYFTTDNSLGLDTQRKLFSYDSGLAMHEFLMKFQDFHDKVWSLGRNTWLLLFCLAYCCYSKRHILIHIPYLMLLITLLLATPVYNEFRYAYAIFAALPILFSYSFGREAAVSGQMGEEA